VKIVTLRLWTSLLWSKLFLDTIRVINLLAGEVSGQILVRGFALSLTRRKPRGRSGLHSTPGLVSTVLTRRLARRSPVAWCKRGKWLPAGTGEELHSFPAATESAAQTSFSVC
jgi:hypothetical protein